MYKKFTLIEMIIAIVTISILASIVLVKVIDLKKQSIVSAISQNTRILQGSVDEYFLKNNKYPVEFEENLSIYSPQKVDIELLLKEGYLKKELDTSKIKHHYYWIDVFGKVWGDTLEKQIGVNVLSNGGDKKMEFILNDKVSGYKLYEVSGYNALTYKEDTSWFADKKPSKKVYKIVDEVNVSGKGDKVVNFKLPNKDSEYLVSTIDEYGLEGPPVGKFSYIPEGSIPSLIKKEGVYEFEIESANLMYWIDFLYLTDTPGKSTIDFDFKIKNTNGEYQEWTTDFYGLEPSTAITVRVDMKGDSAGNKPSLYYSRVLFKYADSPTVPSIVVENPEYNLEPVELCPKSPFSTTLSKTSNSKGEGTIGYYFKINELENFNEHSVPNVHFESNPIYKVLNKKIYISNDNSTYVLYQGENASGKCMYVLYDVEILSVKTDSVDTIKPICGSGGTKTKIKDKGIVVYSLYLSEKESMKDVKVSQNFSSYKILNISYEYSHKGAEYVTADSILDIPSSSCVNIVYEIEMLNCKDCSYPPPPSIETCKDKGDCPERCGNDCKPTGEGCSISCDSANSGNNEDWCDLNHCDEPVCIEFEGECFEPACTTNCSASPPSSPLSSDVALNDPEWTTVDSLIFYGHGAYGQLVRWYRAEHKHEIQDTTNTRILYRYSKSSGYYWSNEYDNFEHTGIATSVMAKAYIQVKTSELKNIKEDTLPKVVSMKFYNEEGVLDMSLIQPTLSIIPNKDNNNNREVFSNASKIEWSYVAADPRNKKIVDIEWAGDIRNQYPVGEYEVKARVKNEVAIWSEWVTYKMVVLEEKPVAIIKMSTNGDPNFLSYKDTFDFSMSQSYDPDGDIIVDYEWKNKNNSYEIGSHIVSLRVKDSEGYWSDWTEYPLNIGVNGVKIYRLEAEDEKVVSNNSNVKRNTSASGENVRSVSSGNTYIIFTFEGTGIDIMKTTADVSNDMSFAIDGVNYSVGKGLTSIRGLSEGTHRVRMDKRQNGVEDFDYFDIYSEKDNITLSNFYSKYVSNGVDSLSDTNIFSTKLNQKLKIYYKQDKDGMVVVNILDEKGNIIKNLSNSQQSGGTAGNYNILWDGKDNSGMTSPNGIYKVEFSTEGQSGTVSKFEYLVELKNEIPIYRLEAEDDKVVSNNSKLKRVNSASGSNVRSFSASMTYVTFVFEGTGIDIMKTTEDVSSSMLFTIDGVNYPVGKGLTSIRGLKKGTHSVRMDKSRLGTEDFDYFDIYDEKDIITLSNLSSNYVLNGVDGVVNTNVFATRLNQSIKVHYKQNKDGFVDIRVLDEKGEVVRNISNKEQSGGTSGVHNVIWNGKNNVGVIVPNGTYKIQFRTKGVYGTTANFEYLVELKNTTPAYRLEAEDNRVVSNNYKLKRNTSASAEYVKSVSFVNTYIIFTFEGTGIDVMKTVSDVSVNMSFRIDGVDYIVGKGLTSIRGLSEGTHSVRMDKTQGGLEDFDYFDIYN